MKTFSLHKVQAVLAITAIGTLFAVAYLLNPSFLGAPRAESATTDNVSGWVWSENIGWVSFNNTSDGSAQSYGVKVDTSTKTAGGIGFITGNAWGEHIGWVSFDRTKTGNPPSNDPGSGSGRIAQVDWSTGKVTGWMRALSACQNSLVDGSGNCTGPGAGDATGGWDGWIRLSEDTNPVWAGNGVKITANKFSGYAWGGDVPGEDVTGWVDFAPKIGGISVGPVIGVPPCTAADVPVGSWGLCQPLVACPTADTTGIQVGLCTAGGTVTRACTTAARVCASAPAGPAGSCGDGVCSSTETPLSCAQDCKLKVKRF